MPVDDSVLTRVQDADLARVPTQTLIQFVDHVSRAETSVNEAFRVVSSQVQRQDMLHSAASNERARAVDLMRAAQRSLTAAKAGLARAKKEMQQQQQQKGGKAGGVNASTAMSTPQQTMLTRQAASAQAAVQRAARSVDRASRALRAFDEVVSPGVKDMVALMSAASEAKAVADVAADAVDVLGTGLETSAAGMELGARKEQVVVQCRAQLDESKRALDECERDLRKLREASAHSAEADVEGLAAIEGAEQAVRAGWGLESRAEWCGVSMFPFQSHVVRARVFLVCLRSVRPLLFCSLFSCFSVFFFFFLAPLVQHHHS
mgnify:CR=1 FL=1